MSGNLFQRLGESIFSKSMNSATSIRYSEFLFNGNSGFECEFLNISPFFYAFGNQFLRNDTRRYGFKANHRLLKNKLNILAATSHTRDNLNGYKSSTTMFLDNSLGFELKHKKNNIKINHRKISTRNVAREINSFTDITTFIFANNSKQSKFSNHLIVTGNLIQNYSANSQSTKNLLVSINNTTRLTNGISIEEGYSYRLNLGKGQEISDSTMSNQAKFSFGFPISKLFLIRSTYSIWNNQMQTFGQLFQINTSCKISRSISFNLSLSIQTINYLKLNTTNSYSFGNFTLIYEFTNN